MVGALSRADELQRLSTRVICTAMCLLVGTPGVPVVPAMAAEKQSAKGVDKAGDRPLETTKIPDTTGAKPLAPGTKPEASGAKPDATGAKPPVKTTTNSDTKPLVRETGSSKAAEILKEAVANTSGNTQKAKTQNPQTSDKNAESESAKKLETGSKSAAVVKEAVSRTAAKAKESAKSKSPKGTAGVSSPKETAAVGTTKGGATGGSTKEKATTAKVSDSEVVPPVAPAIRKGDATTGTPSLKTADDAAFARQFVQSQSNSAKPAAGAQQNADNQSSRIARPGMPASGSGGVNSSLDNQSPRIARPGMPTGGSSSGGAGTTYHAGGVPSNAAGTASGASSGASGAANTGGAAANSPATGGSNGAAPTKVSDTTPPLAPPVTTGGTASQVPKAPDATVQDQYPAVGSLEQVTFGTTKPSTPIEQRITTLESAIFAKTYETESLFDRTERLKRTLMGQDADAGAGGTPGGGMPGYTTGGPPIGAPGTGFNTDPSQPLSPDAVANMQALADLQYLEDFAGKPENCKHEPPNVIEGFAAEVVNFERRKRGLPPLEGDEMLSKMAKNHIADLHKTSALSHTDSRGNNPDRRFTVLGGVDAVSETLAAIDSADLGTSRPTKAAVAKSFKQMMLRTDDRDALMSPDASHIGFAMRANSDGTRILSCTEVLTKRAVIQPLPHTVRLGEKVEVQGILMNPYKFDKITIAWEGKSEDGAVQSYEQVDEALPYFPPLDYIAYKDHSEKDYTKAISTIKTLGMIAAIAGGMFMPPVALAAPLIVMAGPNPEPKPQSDIPVKGSVHIDGQSFTVKIPMSNDSKEGLYYITIWANQGEGTRPVPISRRTLHVTSDEAQLARANTKEVVEEDATGEVEPATTSAKNNPNPFLDTPLSQLKAEPKSLSDLPPAQDGSAPRLAEQELAAPAAAKLTDVPPLPPAPPPAQAVPTQASPPAQATPPQAQDQKPPAQSAPPAAQTQTPAQAPPTAAQHTTQAQTAKGEPSELRPAIGAPHPAGGSNSTTGGKNPNTGSGNSNIGPSTPNTGASNPKSGASNPKGSSNSNIGPSSPNAGGNSLINSNKSELKLDEPEQPTIQ